jgi:hypothetical protein
MASKHYNNPCCMLKLKKTLQGLALPAGEQPKLYPAESAQADELALDFDHWSGCALGNDRDKMTPAQRDALHKIDSALNGLSALRDASLWTPEGLTQRVEWERVRELASDALKEFAWPYQVPVNYEGPVTQEELDLEL